MYVMQLLFMPKTMGKRPKKIFDEMDEIMNFISVLPY